MHVEIKRSTIHSERSTSQLESPMDFISPFVDDCLIFTQASQRGATRIANILDLYNRGSVQLVNKDKSAVFFNGNCSSEEKTRGA